MRRKSIVNKLLLVVAAGALLYMLRPSGSTHHVVVRPPVPLQPLTKVPREAAPSEPQGERDPQENEVAAGGEPCPWPVMSNSDYEEFTAKVPERFRRVLRFKKNSEVNEGRGDSFYLGNAYQDVLSGPHVNSDPMSVLKPGEFAAFPDGILAKPPFSESTYSERLGRHAKGPSVLVVMLDSTSGPQFRREMPLTQAALSEIRDGRHFSFRRFHSFGGGSTRNKVPLHTGRDFDDFLHAGEPAKLALRYDGWSFQRAARAGYVTSLFNTICPVTVGERWSREHYQTIEMGRYFPGEKIYDHDFPRVAICPKTNKMTHMRTCCHKEGEQCVPEEFCIGDEWAGIVGLRWLADLRARYAPVPVFAHICFFDTHGPWLQGERAIDAALSTWLRERAAAGMFKDTALVLTSDHGSTMGFLGTKQGNLETKMPTLELVLPRALLQDVPGLQETLRHNTGILTTPADVYRTMMDLVEYPRCSKTSSEGLGVSLFHRLPVSRSCEDAGIPLSACVCMRESESAKNFAPVEVDEEVKQIAARLMEEINARLQRAQQGFTPCRRLELGGILSAANRVMAIGWGHLWDLHIQVDTSRSEPMHLQALITSHPKRGLLFTEIRQVSLFKPHLERCWREAAATTVSLHLCECT